MSERAEGLLKVIGDTARDEGLAILVTYGYLGADIEWDMDTKPHYAPLPSIARAICEHFGVTWEMVDRAAFCSGPCDKDVADALATLLEAAGVER